MKQMHTCIYGILTTITMAGHAQMPYKAFISVPIADLVGAPIASFVPNMATPMAYAAIPHAPTIEQRASCPRLHQLLFNEIVEVIERTKYEAKVKISTAFYTLDGQKQPQTTYWMRADVLTPLSTITKREQKYIPHPIDFNNAASVESPDTVTLLHPWHDHETHYTFSAGTRFVRAAQHTSGQEIAIWRFNPTTKRFSVMVLPKDHCIIMPQKNTRHDRIKAFVEIIRSWAKQKEGIIPYVLGGTSFTTYLADTQVNAQPWAINPSLACFIRSDDHGNPKIGLDCSSLILRAAQMTGIPYFLKNTRTIATHLQPLQPEQTIQAGDLILITGHVLVVTDIENALVVEARSYDHGYGQVHELALARVFKDIKTVNDLVRVHHGKKRVDRIDSDGKVRDSFSNLTIMRIESAWNAI